MHHQKEFVLYAVHTEKQLSAGKRSDNRKLLLKTYRKG